MPTKNANPPPHRDDRAVVLARRLAELRRERGLSQGAVARIAGTSQATVSRWEDPESSSCPSALELAQLTSHFGVEAGWLLGVHDRREPLPAGAAVMDQALLTAFAEAKTDDELRALLDRQMNFGTLWVEVPAGAELLTVAEALRRVKVVDRHIRNVHPALWREWAEIALR